MQLSLLASVETRAAIRKDKLEISNRCILRESVTRNKEIHLLTHLQSDWNKSKTNKEQHAYYYTNLKQKRTSLAMCE